MLMPAVESVELLRVYKLRMHGVEGWFKEDSNEEREMCSEATERT
jgi:hypothetical protein